MNRNLEDMMIMRNGIYLMLRKVLVYIQQGVFKRNMKRQKGISVYMRALTGSVRKRTFVMTRRKCSMVLRLMNLTGSGRE